MLYAARLLNAEQALATGFLDEVAPDLMSAAHSLAAEMTDKAPFTVAGAKMILNGLTMGPGALDHAELDRLIDRAAESQDFREGRHAFAEKRPPRFRGR